MIDNKIASIMVRANYEKGYWVSVFRKNGNARSYFVPKRSVSMLWLGKMKADIVADMFVYPIVTYYFDQE